MLIAQVTDTHLGFDPGNPSELNRQRLDQVLVRLVTMSPRPDLLIATGDLVDQGDAESYGRLLDAFSNCPFPVWPIPGNHDNRSNFIRAFPQVSTADGFVQYVVEAKDLRLIFIDTLEEGRHGGAYCDARAAWLNMALDAAPDTPSVIIMHHPPVDVGIPWMTTASNEPWVARFAACLEGRRNIISILCGHIHRSISVGWRRQTVTVCASTAPQVGLDLAPLNPAEPDGRSMIIADPPAFALHQWNGSEFVSHFETSDEHLSLARYDEKIQPLVQHLFSERP